MKLFHPNVKEFARTLLTPDMVVECLTSVSIKSLKEKNIEYALLDMDNTFLAPNTYDISLKFKQWIQDAKNQHIKVFIVTNNSNKLKVQKISKELDILALCKAMKPLSFSLEEYAYQYDIHFDKAALIGNQLFTDILLANWLGCYSILTEPVEKKMSFVKTIQQDLEDYIRLNWL